MKKSEQVPKSEYLNRALQTFLDQEFAEAEQAEPFAFSESFDERVHDRIREKGRLVRFDFKRIGRRIAATAAVCILLFGIGSRMSVEGVRQPQVECVKQERQPATDFQFYRSSSEMPATDHIQTTYTLPLPQEFKEVFFTRNRSYTSISWESEDDIMITFSQYVFNPDSPYSVNTEDTVCETVTINGYTGYLYTGADKTALVWPSADYSFALVQYGNRFAVEELMNMACNLIERLPPLPLITKTGLHFSAQAGF